MPGEIEHLTTHLWRIELPVSTLPPYDHTNGYLIADNGVGLLVDPAHDRPEGLERLREALKAAGVRLVKGIVLTHTHSDHVAGLADVVEAFDRPSVYVHAAEAARLPADTGPIVVVVQDRVLTVGDVTAELLHTPGHSPGHLTILLRSAPGDVLEAALAGDLVAAAGSVWVGLPEGDVAAYLESLDRLIRLAPPLIGPGHGPALQPGPAAAGVVGRLEELRDHRLSRERQVLAALREGPASASDITAAIYPGLGAGDGGASDGGTDKGGAGHGNAGDGGAGEASATSQRASAQVADLARRSVLAHLEKLVDEARVRRLPPTAAGETGELEVAGEDEGRDERFVLT